MLIRLDCIILFFG